MKSLFGLVKKASSRRSTKLFKLYEAKDYAKMVEAAETMKPAQFLRETVEDFTLVHRCVLDDNVEALQHLARLPYIHEVVNNQSNEQGWTPLLFAARSSNKTDLQAFDLLVQCGADLMLPKQSDGINCLHIAATTNDVQLLDYIFLSLGSELKQHIHSRNNEGWTAAHFSAFLNNFDSLNFLLENGAKLTDRNDQGMTPVEEMIRNDHKDLLSCIYQLVQH
jgi:ankyrin repeat protein